MFLSLLKAALHWVITRKDVVVKEGFHVEQGKREKRRFETSTTMGEKARRRAVCR